MQLVFHDVICSLSSSLDLVGVTEVHHGKRVALMAAKVAKALGWHQEMELDMLYAGMLHDCGVSSSEEHSHLVSELEWKNVDEHCKQGFEYLTACQPFSKYAVWIRHHHTRWNELEKLTLSENDKLAANLIFLVDRVDFLQAPYVNFDNSHNDILLEKKRIETEIQAMSGTLFSPLLVDAFLTQSRCESFWLSMDASYITSSLHIYSTLAKHKVVNFDTLRSIAALFSKVIDAKSHYTEEHSKHVALLSRFLAEKFNFCLEQQQHIEIAGLLHDLGKLRVPDYILNKNGALNDTERACMLRHSFDTMQLLEILFPDTQIAQWAGYHHENLNGNGYPFHLTASQLDLGSRIVAVSDVFQALVQKRPYRESLNLSEIKEIMDKMVADGKLDKNVVEVLQQHGEVCYRLAQSA